MRKRILNNIAFFVTAILIFSCNEKLESGVIYEFEASSQIADGIGASVRTKNSTYPLQTKEFKVFFRIFENGLTDLILRSDNIDYSFSGEYQFYDGKGEFDNVYSLILNGKTYESQYEHPTMLNFMVDPNEMKVYSMSGGTFPTLTESLSLSTVSEEQYKEAYQEGLKNSFLPVTIAGFYQDEVEELDDYWIDYLAIEDEAERREQIRKRKEEEERAKMQRNNTSKKPSKLDKITLNDARAFMTERLTNINQVLVASYASQIEGYTVYAFFSNSLDRPGYSCVSMVPDFELNVLASDCNLTSVKVREWNAIPGSPKIY